MDKLWTNNFILITVVSFLIFFGFQMLLPTLPILANSLGANKSTIGLINGLFTISAISIRPIAGLLLDKFGRKSIFIIGLVIFFLSVISYSIVSTLSLVLLIRFVHGFGWGATSTAISTVASDNIPKQRFGEGMGFYSLASSLAMAIGPAIGLFITANYDFSILFYTSASLALLSLLLSFFFKYKPVEDVKENKSLAIIEKTSIAPATMIFFLTITYGTVVSFLSLYAQEQGIANIGLFFTIYAGSLLITRPMFGKTIDSFGFDYAIIPGIVCVAVAMILLSFAATISMFLFIAFLYGIGFGACQSALQTMAVINSPPSQRGAANATFFVGFDSGIGIGSIIYGLLASSLGYSLMYQLTLLPIAMALLLYLIVGRKK